VAETRAHLVTEASRIDEFLRSTERNPPVSLRLLREKQARLNATQKGLQDVEEATALGRQRREGLTATLALSQEKMAHLNAEEALLNRKSSGLRSLFQSVPLLFSGNVEKKYLYKRMPFQQQQLAAIEEFIGLNETLRSLLDGEAAYLRGEQAALLARYEQRLLWPAGLLAALVAIYILFGRLLVPHLMVKDHQIVGRRVTGYLCSFAGLLVLVAFFFEDLRSVATILGIASAAVVIALQDMCSSFAGWFVIMSGHKFAVGHRVEIDGQRGDVIDIQLLRTTLVEVDNWLGVDEPTGRIIVVPNSFVFRSKFFNYTYLHPFIWSKLDITVTYETPPGEAEALFRRVLEEETREEFAAAREAAKTVEHHYGVADATYQPKLYVYIADSGVQYRLVYCAHYRRIGATRNRINTRLLREFEANPRLQFAYPTERHIPTPEKGGLHVALDRST
jgi:small-conductance mechanosensitive channel